MRIPTPSPPGHPEVNRSLRLRETEALANSLETRFQPVTVSSVPAVIEIVDVARRCYILTPDSETNHIVILSAVECGMQTSQILYRVTYDTVTEHQYISHVY